MTCVEFAGRLLPPATDHAGGVRRATVITPDCLLCSLSSMMPCQDANSRQDARLRTAFLRWLAGDIRVDPAAEDIDVFLFGRGGCSCRLDPRIERAIKRIRTRPCEQLSASECARYSGTSRGRGDAARLTVLVA